MYNMGAFHLERRLFLGFSLLRIYLLLILCISVQQNVSLYLKSKERTSANVVDMLQLYILELNLCGLGYYVTRQTIFFSQKRPLSK